MKYLVAIATGLLWSCTAISPDVEPVDLGDVEIPKAWADAAATPDPVRVQWWLELDDPELTALIEEAFAHNFDLRAAAARIDAAEEQARIAGAELQPQLDVSLNGSRQRNSLVGFPIPSGSGSGFLYTRYGVSLNASWEIDLWGRIRSGMSAAAADYEAVIANYAAARQSLAAQVAKSYVAAIESQLQIDLAERTVELFATTEEQVEERVRRGVRGAFDLRLARNNRALAEAARDAARERMALARRQLELLLGRYPAGEVEARSDLPSLPDRVPAGLPAELLRRRPDVVAAERALAASAARVDEAHAALFPRLSLTGSAGTATAELQDLVDNDFGVWSIAAGLVQPIWAGGQLRAREAQARAAAREAAANYATAALTAYSEVENALASEGFLRQRADDLSVAVSEADEARRIAEDRYGRGLDEILNVLESQRRTVTAASDHISVRRSIIDARIDLHLSLGGGFSPPPQQPAVEEDTPK